jgi:hypothetical protein
LTVNKFEPGTIILSLDHINFDERELLKCCEMEECFVKPDPEIDVFVTAQPASAPFSIRVA